CLRPDLAGKVADTPKVDPTMITFMKKYARDPEKGLDRAWRICLNKLFDITVPLTKILELAYQAKDSGFPMDTDVLIGWAQRVICQLGNTNCVISSKRRHSILMRIDPKLNNLVTYEAGPVEEGLLFGGH
ncbi:hypothetical protein NDU88_006532, partial [Pleurodeles waltl]